MRRFQALIAVLTLVTTTACPQNDERTLTVEFSGGGIIHFTPDVGDCDSTCQRTFKNGTEVTVTASPDEFFSFTRWSDDCTGPTDCAVSMTADRLVRPEFQRSPTEFVTVELIGDGTVASDPARIDCPPTCTGEFLTGQTVTLTPSPSAPNSFKGWYGACRNDGVSPCTLTLNSSRTAQAAFSEDAGVWWARAGGGAGFDQAWDVATDALGNVVVVGTFLGTADFGAGPMDSAGNSDYFVAKYDALGAIQWSQRFGGTGSGFRASVAIDSVGDILVHGDFSGSVDFGGGPIVSQGGVDVFLLKLTGAGDFKWARGFGGNTIDYGHDVAVDADRNIFIGGYCRSPSIDFGDGTKDCTNAPPFLAKYDPDGNTLWSRLFVTTEGVLESVAVDGTGSVVFGGYYQGTIDFGGGNTMTGGRAFFAKLDSDGNYVWSNDVADGYVNSIGINDIGTVAVTGAFTADIDWGNGTLSPIGATDIFVTVFSAGNALIWSDSFGDINSDFGNEISIDANGEATLLADFYGTIDFGAGSLTSAQLDPALVAFDALGNARWSFRVGGASGDVGQSLAVDQNGNVVCGGGFRGLGDFGNTTLQSTGNSDAFVLRVGR